MKFALAAVLAALISDPAFAGMNYPPLVAGQLPGTKTNDNAASGKVGELQTANVGSGAAVSLPIAGTDTTVVTLALPAGDWDVNGTLIFGGTSVNATLMVAGINTTTNVQPTQPTTGRASIVQTAAAPSNAMNTGTVRVTSTGSASAFLIGSCVAGAGTCTGFGIIMARRAR